MKPTHCNACRALFDECGSHFSRYSKMLLKRGWAGATSPVENAFRKAHGGAR